MTIHSMIRSALVLVAMSAALTVLSATCGCAEPCVPPETPDAMPDVDRGCNAVCAWEDDDPVNLPSGRCPGATYEACILECTEGVADGNFCAAP